MSTIKIPKLMFYSLIIGIIAIATIFVFAMKDGNECLSKPMNYGAAKAITSDSGAIQCSCIFQNPSYAPFYFDDKNMSLERLSEP